MRKTIRIPFKHGKMIPNSRVAAKTTDVEWVDNFDFEARLQVIGLDKIQGSHRFILKDDEGGEYLMSLPQFERMMKNKVIRKGRVDGTFTFLQSGNTFSLKLSHTEVAPNTKPGKRTKGGRL